MRSQEQAFRAYYGAMSDAELLQIAAHRTSYLPVAQRILSDEMQKRRLNSAEPPAGVARPSILWNWGRHLLMFARRPRHHPAAP